MSDTPRNLWAPWRIDYLEGLAERTPSPGAPPTLERGSGCFLCDATRADLMPQEAEDRLVLLRDERGTLMLNRYPYANGHLLAVPPEHTPSLSALSPSARSGLIELAALAERLLSRAVHAQGVNVGMNLGRCAGAAEPGHAHLHAVPRWSGDVNFMPTTAGVRVVPQSLEDSYRRLRETLAQEAQAPPS
ncbi:MAG: HIT domain-containing protein [Planctomycetota bacterium]